MKKNLLTLIIVLLFPFISFSQSPSVESLELFLKKYYTDGITGLKEGKDINEYMENFTPDFKFHDIDIDIDGALSIKTQNKSQYKKDLIVYQQMELLFANYSLANTRLVSVNGNTGVAKYTLEYSLLHGKDLISRGTSNHTMIAKYSNGRWRAQSLTTFIVFDEINSGECFCEVFSKGKGQFIVELMYPNGEEYEKNTIKIQIQDPIDNPLQLIPFIKDLDVLKLDKKKDYRVVKVNKGKWMVWDIRTGNLYDKDENIITKEKSRSKLIREITRLQQKERCSEVLLRKKRKYK